MRYAVACTALGGRSPPRRSSSSTASPSPVRCAARAGSCASCGCGVSGAVVVVRLVAAQERQHAAHLVEPGRAEGADVRERLARALGLAVEEVQSDAGLHGDLAQRVGEHVVQLARDAACAPPARSAVRRSASCARRAAPCSRRARMPSPMPKQSARPRVVIATRNGCQLDAEHAARDDRDQPRRSRPR